MKRLVFSCVCLISSMLALPVSAKHLSENDFKIEKNDIQAAKTVLWAER